MMMHLASANVYRTCVCTQVLYACVHMVGWSGEWVQNTNIEFKEVHRCNHAVI